MGETHFNYLFVNRLKIGESDAGTIHVIGKRTVKMARRNAINQEWKGVW